MKERDLSKLVNAKLVYNTTSETMQKYWPKFSKFITRQLEHGNSKYVIKGQENKQSTDFICEMSPGKSGFDWILQTITKYCLRYINRGKEEDLFKIAAYAYIAWLKGGHQLGKDKYDEDIQREDSTSDHTPNQLRFDWMGPIPAKDDEDVPVPILKYSTKGEKDV